MSLAWSLQFGASENTSRRARASELLAFESNPFFALATLFSYLTWLLFLAGAINLGAHEYRGNGVITYKVWDAESGEEIVGGKSASRFRFSVSNELWQIRTELVADSDFAHFEGSYDGTNTYLITTIKEDAFLRRAKVDKIRQTNVIAQVFPTDFPPLGSAPINPVWLAYASGYYFRSLTNNLIRPLWWFDAPAIYSVDYFVPAEFTALQTDPFVLSSCTVFCDGSEYGLRQGQDNAPAITRLKRYPKPYSSGFRRARYSVSETTNVAGSVFPKQFQLQVFLPRKDGQSTNDLLPVCQYEGVLDRLEYGASDLKLRDGLRPFTTVVDYRTLKLKPATERVRYRTPTNQFLPMLPGFLPHQVYKMNMAARPHTTRPRGNLVLILLGVFLAPAVLIGIKAFRARS